MRKISCRNESSLINKLWKSKPSPQDDETISEAKSSCFSLSEPHSFKRQSLIPPPHCCSHPRPKPSNLPSNECDCARMPARECPPDESHSDGLLPLLPFCGPAILTLLVARVSTRLCTASLASPKLPNTIPWTVGKERSLFSAGPILPSSTPPKSLSVFLAFS